MKNWLGQDIEVGSYVYRGAREGNTSSFKVGKIIAINEVKRTARVRWMFEPLMTWCFREEPDLAEQSEKLPQIDWMSQVGSPSIESLVLLSAPVEDLIAAADVQEALKNESYRRRGATITFQRGERIYT